jgi:hypothetical protein
MSKRKPRKTTTKQRSVWKGTLSMRGKRTLQGKKNNVHKTNEPLLKEEQEGGTTEKLGKIVGLANWIHRKTKPSTL